jgi:HlyD family secretion protein
MQSRHNKLTREILEYQPDAVEIEDRPIPGTVRWVLYLILGSLIGALIGAVIFKVDRIVVAAGKLITTSPTIIVQPLNTAIIRSIEVQVGDMVEKDQLLATLDSTFASADLSQLTRQHLTLGAQIRRVKAELENRPFSAKKTEGDDGILQAQIFRQRKVVLDSNRRTYDHRIAALQAELSLNRVRRKGKEQQLKLLRDVEGATARLPQNGTDYRLRILEAQRSRFLTGNEIDNLQAENLVVQNEMKQARSEWQRFVEERNGELMEQEVQLRNELEKISEEINKARRLHDLVSLRAPDDGIVLKMINRSVGSIVQQAEPFFVLVPMNSTIEAEVDIKSRDIARVRIGDSTRIKLDAFPFQRHGTLPGQVRVISEDASAGNISSEAGNRGEMQQADSFYRTRIEILATKLRDVPDGFRLMPGMKVRTEIKIGKRSIITYFLYPIIRAFDESLREP